MELNRGARSSCPAPLEMAWACVGPPLVSNTRLRQVCAQTQEFLNTLVLPTCSGDANSCHANSMYHSLSKSRPGAVGLAGAVERRACAHTGGPAAHKQNRHQDNTSEQQTKEHRFKVRGSTRPDEHLYATKRFNPLLHRWQRKDFQQRRANLPELEAQRLKARVSSGQSRCWLSPSTQTFEAAGSGSAFPD